MDFGAIINWLLWRFAPAQWLESKVAELLSWAMDLLEDEDQRAWLDQHRRNAAWFGGWLVLIEARLDELIDLRAHQLLNWRWDPRAVPPHHNAPGVRSASDAFDRLMRLMERFADAERLARRRSRLLARFAEERQFSPWASSSPACGGSGAQRRWGRVTSAARSSSSSSSSSSIFENAYAYGRKYESPPAAAAFSLKMADERVSVCSHPSFSRIRAPP